MIHDSLEFHNVEQLEAVPCGGWKLQRFPESLRCQLGAKGHTRGRFFSHFASGCEIRLVTPEKFFAITLSAEEVDTTVFIERGDFFHSRHELKQGVKTRLFVETPAMFQQVDPGMLSEGRFSPELWRIRFHQDARIVYHGIDGFGSTIRPPHPEEKPHLRWLAYGSSITFGGNALLPGSTYIQHAARRLGADVLNKGIPGSCLCEPEMVDYLCGHAGWDFATLELGVNMVELFTPEEFEVRARTLIQTMQTQQPDRRIFVINIFPNRANFWIDDTDPAAVRTPIYNQIIRKIVSEINSPFVRIIEGEEVLSDLSGLTTDLVHPSDYGHLLMGENLAKLIRPMLKL